MTLASTNRSNCTDEAKARWLLRMKDPQYRPMKFEQTDKASGSRVLQFGKWVEV